jgi:hypothetical protein
MRVRTLIVLAAITVPVAAAAILLPDHVGSVTAPVGGGRLLPNLKSKLGQVATMTVAGADGTLTLHRAQTTGKPEDGWTFTDKGGYPVPAATVKPILDGLLALHGIEPKTERPKLFPRLDLGDPGKGSDSHLITLTDASGAAIGSMLLGKHKEDSTPGNSTERQYVRIPGTQQTWLAAPAITLPDEKLDWIDHAIIDIDADKIKQIAVSPTEGGGVMASRAKAADKLTVQDLPKGAKLKSENAGTDLAGAVRGLELSDVKPAAKLAGSTAGTAHVETLDGLTADLTLAKDGGQTWITVAAAGTGAAAKQAADIAARTRGWAYQIDDTHVKLLLTKLDDITEAAPKAVAPPPPAPVAKKKK